MLFRSRPSKSILPVSTFPCAFGRIDFEGRALHVDAPLNGVENKEFRFRTEESRVAQSRGLQVLGAALCDGARIAIVTFTVGRLDDVAGNRQRRLGKEGIDERRSRV